MPVSSASPSASARAASAEKIAAVRPNSLSFISRMASSSEATFMMPTAGPKVSSRMMAIEWSTPTSTCGARYGVPGAEAGNDVSSIS